jgi:uncharacterized membrane protein YgcG
MKSVALLVLFLASEAACTKRNPAACCTTAEDCNEVGLPLGSNCEEGLSCVFGTCILATCTSDGDCPAEVPRCDTTTGGCVECLDSSECGDLTCNANNQCAACTVDDECADGFCVGGSCRTTIVPKYLPEVCDTIEVDPLELVSFNTTIEGTICTQIIAQANGPDVCIIHASSISIAATESVKIRGSRALVLVADGDITIDGTLDLSGDKDVSGPGGGKLTGGSPSGTSGGGGGGFAGAGGAGGTTIAGGAANGGAAIDPLALPVLEGGTAANGSTGGGAGGALMLVSCRGAIRVSGLIDLGGGGGGGGASNNGVVTRGGAGGGSGGFGLFQAVTFEVTGQIFANGGGGGGGSPITPQGVGKGGDGAEGTRSEVAATGGVSQGFDSGGDGGAATTSAEDGKGSITNFGPGGGGGSVGALLVLLPVGRTPETTGSTSPTIVSGDIAVQ